MTNMFVDGEWRTDVDPSSGEDGEFEREQTAFRDRIRDDPDARFPAEAGRYHLYISRACPWAHGAALVRRLTGLDDGISMDVVDPYRDENGWKFTPEKDGCTPDTVNGFDYLREAYVAADPEYTGRVSVPVLWDRETETIVNNESIEIMQMLDDAFGASDNGLDLWPPGRREEVDRIVDEIYDPINNGVYRAGFAGSQAAYDRAVNELFAALDHWDETLAERRYLAGEQLTLADLRIFPTLVRFDEVYHTVPTTLPEVNPNITDPHEDRWKQIKDYPNLSGFTRDIYQTDGVAQTVNMDHIVEHYGSPGSPPGFDPKEVDEGDLNFDAPHNRERLSSDQQFAQ